MGLNLRQRRKELGLTVVDVAKSLGVSQPTYSYWENGRFYPTADKLPALAELFGCTIDALYFDGQTSPDATILPENGGGNHGA